MVEIAHNVVPLVSDQDARKVVMNAWSALRRDVRKRNLSIAWVGLKESEILNGRYRGKKKPTNVLSFMHGEHMGARTSEIILCSSVIRQEAKALGFDARQLSMRFLVHGILHTEGFVHNTRDHRMRMERKEKQILLACGCDVEMV